MATEPDPPSTDQTPELSAAEQTLLAAADVRLAPVRITLSYQVALALVATAMVLLPLLYVLLILALGVAVWLYATLAFGLLGSGLWGAVGYLAPIVGGLAGILFMIKPIFAPPAPAPPRLVLAPEDQPLLYAYVERLCRALGASPPSEIVADMRVNASASLRGGLRGLVGGQLVLTIGLPLVAGLDVRQLSGILAHEFGHFTQWTALRFSYVVGAVNQWFARVVFERDSWDQRLARAEQELRAPYLGAFVLLAKLSVAGSRRVLWALMHIGHALSARLSRQMEYHADAHEALIIGSAGFRETYLRLALLDFAQQVALEQVNRALPTGRLVDDLAALTCYHASRMTAETAAREQFEQALLAQRTGPFDTHPSAADRLRHAERLALAPAIAVTLPATGLFHDFDGLAARLTAAVYHASLGDAASRVALITAAEAARETDELVRSVDRLQWLGGGGPALQFGLAPRATVPTLPEDRDRAVAALAAARERLRGVTEWAQPVFERYERVLATLRGARAGVVLNAAGVPFSPHDLQIATNEPDEVSRLADQAETERVAVRAELAAVFTAVTDRVDAAVALAAHPDIRSLLGAEGAVVDEYATLAGVLGALAGQWPQLAQSGNDELHLRLLAGAAGRQSGQDRFEAEGARVLRAAHDRAVLVLEALQYVPYPFAQSGESKRLARYACPGDLHRDLALLGDIGQLRERLLEVYQRCWGRIAALVERVEAAVGLAPPGSDPATSNTAP